MKPDWIKKLEADYERSKGYVYGSRFNPDVVEPLLSALNKAYEALEQWEAWEADLLMDHEAWPRSLPQFTQHLFDEYLKVQAKRNEAFEAINQEGK